MRFLYFTITLVVIVDVISPISGAEILVSVLIPIASSHPKGMSAIAGALTQRGHKVTILTSSTVGTYGFQPDTYSKAVHYHFADMSDSVESIQEEIASLAFGGSWLKFGEALRKAFDLQIHGCSCLLNDDSVLEQLKESKFDLVVGDVFDGCDALIGAYLNVPFVAVTTSPRYPLFHEHIFGIPAPSSYVPFGLIPLSEKMSFTERVLSYIEHHIIITIFEWINFQKINVIKDAHGIAPGRDVQDLLAGAEIWLCMTDFALDFARPTAPNWISIGAITNTPVKPLSKEYEDFVEGSGDHGFIVFSLGTHFTEFPDLEMAEAFARVFSELSQRVLWRYTGPRPRHLGNNTKLVTWLPQNDLLAHPKARLLIYHGGINGIYEAIYHAVPMVVMPIFADQYSNAVKIEVKGMGRRLQKEAINYETVKSIINEVLQNPSYAETARRLSGIYRDNLSEPDKTVVFWIEHVLKYGGSHLRTRAKELSFIQLHSIDVVAFILGIIVVNIILLSYCCKRCLRCCSNVSKESKKKTE